MRPRLRSFHRVLGVVMVAPLVLWTLTGLAFLVKPGWAGAYEALDPWQPQAFDTAGIVPLPRAVQAFGAVERVEAATSALGPIYRLSAPGGARQALVDARSGELLSPLSAEAARVVAVDAAARAAEPRRYGAVVATSSSDDAVEVVFSGGAVVTVGRHDLALAQRGADTELIDALYRVHYLQWTGSAAVDRLLALGAIAGTWLLAALGIALLRRPRRSSAE